MMTTLFPLFALVNTKLHVFDLVGSHRVVVANRAVLLKEVNILHV